MNSAWIVFFVSLIIKSCDIIVHTQKKKSKNAKRRCHFQWNSNGYYMLKNLTSCYSKLSFFRAHYNKMLSFFNVFNSLSPDSHSRSLLSLFLRLSLLWVQWGRWWLQVEVCPMTASGSWVQWSMGSWVIFLLWFA